MSAHTSDKRSMLELRKVAAELLEWLRDEHLLAPADSMMVMSMALGGLVGCLDDKKDIPKAVRNIKLVIENHVRGARRHRESKYQ